MFSNTEEIITYDLNTNEYNILDKECLLMLNQNFANFKIFDFDVCAKGYSISYKKNLFLSFN